MKEQPHYTDVLTESFFLDHYVEKRMSFPKITAMLQEQGYNIAVGTVFKYAKNLGIGRDRSEAKRNREPNPLDFTASYMTEASLEAVDGFMLGDGAINYDKRSQVKAARLCCGVEHNEFAMYLMSFFTKYLSKVIPCQDAKMKCGIRQQGYTASHPDFYIQKERWCIEGNLKQPPDDVRITPLSVMMWYLGDGSVVQPENGSTVMLRLSTDGFNVERVEYLVSKLNEKGIDCHRNKDNRIQVEAKGIPSFFNFIGRKSPVECYAYKFDLPEWRFEAKRMSEVADELGIEYQKLAYWVKIGKVPCYRASEKGKPRFLPEHIEAIKEIV